MLTLTVVHRLEVAAELLELLRAFAACPRVRLEPVIGPVRLKRRPKPMIPVKLNDQQEITLAVAPVGGSGLPASVQSIRWALADGTTPADVAQLFPSEDGLSCDVVPKDLDVAATFDVICTADADLGEGVIPISETFNVTVDPEIATALRGTAGVPRPKRAP